jgi:hypothetical protein
MEEEFAEKDHKSFPSSLRLNASPPNQDITSNFFPVTMGMIHPPIDQSLEPFPLLPTLRPLATDPEERSSLPACQNIPSLLSSTRSSVFHLSGLAIDEGIVLQHQRVVRRRHCFLDERAKFLLLIKILLRYLSRHPELQQRAKRVVAECTRRNRMGEANYRPLKQAVETHLRFVVGNKLWTRAKRYCDYYCEQVERCSQIASV